MGFKDLHLKLAKVSSLSTRFFGSKHGLVFSFIQSFLAFIVRPAMFQVDTCMEMIYMMDFYCMFLSFFVILVVIQLTDLDRGLGWEDFWVEMAAAVEMMRRGRGFHG